MRSPHPQTTHTDLSQQNCVHLLNYEQDLSYMYLLEKYNYTKLSH